MSVERMAPDELQALAKRAALGEVYISNSDAAMRYSWPILLAFVPDLDEALKDVGALWEEMSKAGPRSINGYPFFTSAHLVHVDDVEPLRLAIDEKLRLIESL